MHIENLSEWELRDLAVEGSCWRLRVGQRMQCSNDGCKTFVEITRDHIGVLVSGPDESGFVTVVFTNRDGRPLMSIVDCVQKWLIADCEPIDPDNARRLAGALHFFYSQESEGNDHDTIS